MTWPKDVMHISLCKVTKQRASKGNVKGQKETKETQQYVTIKTVEKTELFEPSWW